jgi:hypothetical protein
MSIPSARLSGKSRRLPTANNHTATQRVRASPQQQHSEPRVRTAHAHVASLANPRTQHTVTRLTYICQPVDHSSTSHTGVRTLPATAATPFTGVARAASLACIAARTATSGSTHTHIRGCAERARQSPFANYPDSLRAISHSTTAADGAVIRHWAMRSAAR